MSIISNGHYLPPEMRGKAVKPDANAQPTNGLLEPVHLTREISLTWFLLERLPLLCVVIFGAKWRRPCRKEWIMPAKSKAQQMAAGAALSAKRGETKMSALKGASKDMAKTMTEKELDDLASTSHKGLPAHKED